MTKIIVNDSRQSGYVYELVASEGGEFAINFTPELTPKEMLALGVFNGFYAPDYQVEFPADWFVGARISLVGPDPECNFFKISASQPLEVWQKKSWIYPEDPLGWFQWYCRYYLGRRIALEDERQIKRWRAIKRHLAALQKACPARDLTCRPRQRQALLHWAYDSRNI